MRAKLGGYVTDNDSAGIYRRWGYNDVCCPQDVRDAIAKCPEGEELVFEVNSGGGSVYQGFEMYSLIRACGGPTRAEVQGIAGSIMSVVVSACDTVLMHPVAQMMIHRSSVGARGNSRVMKETKQMLDTIDESILNAYTGKASGKTERDAFARMMRSETFLTAQQAIDCGLADGILEQEAGQAAACAAAEAAMLCQLPPVEDLLRREQERETATGAEAAETSAGLEAAGGGGRDIQPSREGGTQQRSEANMEIETKEQLAEKFPELTAQIAQEAAEAAAKTAAEAAAKAERDRIAGIDALAMPGFEDIIRKAKEDPEQNAGTVGQAIVLAQKQAGGAYLAQAQQDVQESGVNQVPAASSEAGASEETLEQAAKAAVEVWKKEGGAV